MTYKIRMYLAMPLVWSGVRLLGMLDREPRRPMSNSSLAATVFAVFVIVAVGVMWWAFEQEISTSCHPIQAQRITIDGHNGATTQCR